MEKYRAAPSGQLEVLEFNDEQLAKVGAALQALADEISTTNQSMREDIIDLLSDSDCDDENSQKSASKASLSHCVYESILSQAQLEGKADENQTRTNYSKSTSGTFVVDCAENEENAYKTLDWNQPFMSYESRTKQSNLNNTIGYLEQTSKPKDLEKFASVSSESLHVQNKFNYEAIQSNKMEKGINKNQHPCPSRSTYITLTDITGEQIQVKEVNVSQLLKTREEVLTSAKPKVQMQKTLSLQNKIGNQLVNEELLIEAKPGFRTEQASVQPSYIEDRFIKLDAYPNEDSVSREDSNGNSAVFGIDVVDMDDNAGELSDHSTKQILIDLVDSETEDEQETGELVRAGGVSKIMNRSTTSSIDCFMVYSCPECGLECGSALDWKLHTDNEHKFSTIGALNMQTIIDKAGHICYQCRDCAQKFELHKTFYKLLPHRISHLPNENYVRCRICDMSFRNKSYVRRHLIKVHYKICRDYLQKGKRPNAYAMKYVKITCPMCNQHIGSRKQWHEHLEENHDFSKTCMSQVSLISNDVYVCAVCDVKLRKRSIPEHMLTHEKTKSFACTYCNKYEANHIGMALTHVRRVHLTPANELEYKCKYCGETFQKMSDRTNHMRQMHKMKRPKCAICEKEFFSISLLLSHMNFANHHKLK